MVLRGEVRLWGWREEFLRSLVGEHFRMSGKGSLKPRNAWLDGSYWKTRYVTRRQGGMGY